MNKENCSKADELSDRYCEISDRIQFWETLDKIIIQGSKGHIHFKLGILYLCDEKTEEKGFGYLKKAYSQDKKSARSYARNMSAYRFLNFSKDFFKYLKNSKTYNSYLRGDLRKRFVYLLGAIYDHSLGHILDDTRHPWVNFWKIIKNRRLSAMAIENYDACERLFLAFSREDSCFIDDDQYAIARAITILYGSALECLLLHKFKVRSQALIKKKIFKSINDIYKQTLGSLVLKGFKTGIIKKDSMLGILCLLILYFRNHIHPGKEICRARDYPVDLNLARIIKTAFDFVIIDFLNKKTPKKIGSGASFDGLTHSQLS